MPKIDYILVDDNPSYQISRFGGVVNTLPCYMPGNPFGGVGSNPAGDENFFCFFCTEKPGPVISLQASTSRRSQISQPDMCVLVQEFAYFSRRVYKIVV